MKLLALLVLFNLIIFASVQAEVIENETTTILTIKAPEVIDFLAQSIGVRNSKGNLELKDEGQIFSLECTLAPGENRECQMTISKIKHEDNTEVNNSNLQTAVVFNNPTIADKFYNLLNVETVVHGHYLVRTLGIEPYDFSLSCVINEEDTTTDFCSFAIIK